ncbi:MAG: hypothetical protein JWP14_2153 [Frankiales bacterium]|nr:hypothetical protein [Frankiales bacterium]
MSRGPGPALLVLITCLAASVCYIGTVTEGALVTLLLPTVAVVGLLAVRLRDRGLRALVLVISVTAVASEAVNIASGAYQGPAARSTAVAALVTGLAVVLSGTRRPASFLFPVVAVVAWSLALGAGGQVQLVALITAGLALLALAAVEREQRAFVVPPRWQSASLVLALLLVVGAGVFASLFQLHNDGRQAASPFQKTLARTITPPSFLSLSNGASTPHATSPAAPARSSSGPASPRAAAAEHRSKVRRIVHDVLWAVLVVIAALLLAVAGRLVWAAWAWGRLYSRLVRSAVQPEAGAWLWTVAHLSRTGVQLPAHSSPDRVAAGALDGLTEPLYQPVQQLARSVAPAVFAAPGTALSTEDVWRMARSTANTAWTSAGRLRRTHARWRLP